MHAEIQVCFLTPDARITLPIYYGELKKYTPIQQKAPSLSTSKISTGVDEWRGSAAPGLEKTTKLSHYTTESVATTRAIQTGQIM